MENYIVTKYTPKIVEQEEIKIEMQFPCIFKAKSPGSNYYYKITREKNKFRIFYIHEETIDSLIEVGTFKMDGSTFNEFVIENSNVILKINPLNNESVLEEMKSLLEEINEKLF